MDFGTPSIPVRAGDRDGGKEAPLPMMSREIPAFFMRCFRGRILPAGHGIGLKRVDVQNGFAIIFYVFLSEGHAEAGREMRWGYCEC